MLGGCQGSTGPSSPAPDGRPWGSRFPILTIRDQVAAEVILALIEAEQVGACLGELLAAIPGHAPGGAAPTRRGSVPRSSPL